jgi:hypothetical protein
MSTAPNLYCSPSSIVNVTMNGLRIEFAHRGHDANVGKAMLQVESAQQVAIRLDPVRIIDVARLHEAEEIGLGGLDDVLEPVVRIIPVADETDALDAGFLAFVDLENEIHAIVRELDDLRHHAHVVAPVAPILLDDALGVRLHDRAGQRATNLRLNLAEELLVLGFDVPLECDPVDDRIFDNRHIQPTAGLTDADILEQAGCVEALQAFVNGRGVQAAAGRFEVGADGVGFDPAIPFDHDTARRLGIGWPSRHCDRSDAEKDSPEDKGCQPHSPPNSGTDSHSHALLSHPFGDQNRKQVSTTTRFYSLGPKAQTKPLQSTTNPGHVAPSPHKVPPRRCQEAAKWMMSLKVAKIINITTSANPTRKPISWARSDSGFPRTASIP